MTHGTKGAYDRHKCRCAECTAANTQYQRDRRKKRAAEQWKREING